MTCHKASELDILAGALSPQKGDFTGVRKAEWHKAVSACPGGGERVLAGTITSFPAGKKAPTVLHPARSWRACKEGNRYGNWAIKASITQGHTLGADLGFTWREQQSHWSSDSRALG